MKDFNSEMVKKYGNRFLPPNWEYRKARNNSKSNIYGFGRNDVEFVTKPTINLVRITHPAYSIWEAMLNRCYGSVSKSNINYAGVSCCIEWHSLHKFILWWSNNFIPGYQLDKDLLVKNNQIYGPDTCVFAPANINSFITIRER